MAWFGPAVDVNAKYKHAQLWGIAGHALGGCSHGRTRTPTKLGTAPQRTAPDKRSTAQRDAEVMVEQAIVPHVSSHGESTGEVPGVATGGMLHGTRCASGQSRVGLGRVGVPDIAR